MSELQSKIYFFLEELQKMATDMTPRYFRGPNVIREIPSEIKLHKGK